MAKLAEGGQDARGRRPFEAKNKLAALLDEVEGGEGVTITRHGRPVARLVALASVIDLRAAQDAAHHIVARSKGVTLGGAKIKDLINEGRR